jgi:hypothetical protein
VEEGMVSKFVGALKCFLKRPVDSMRVMMSMDTRDPQAVEAIKAHCPDIDVESVGFYAGIFLAVVFLAFCILAYVMSLFYGAGGI